MNDKALSVSRRQFLKQTMLAAGSMAVPSLIPASALGRGGMLAPSERILVGVIGIGGRGTHDVGWLLNQNDTQIVAVCDVRKTKREAAKQIVDKAYSTNDCAMCSDMREFLAARKDIDAVLIATGDRWHAAASIMAMRAGKDVYCEKPSCHSMEQGLKVVETAKRLGRIYQTGAQRLSEPNHIFAIEMARTGRLGKIHTAYADIRYRGGAKNEWLPEQPLPPKEELDWDAWLGPSPWRPYNIGYVNHQWYNYYDFATDAAMWGAHTVAQALAGIDMSTVSHIDFEYSGPGATMDTRLSNGVKLVLYRDHITDCWAPCEFWHGACGERFDGPDGWAGAADGYEKPDVSSPRLLMEFKKVISDYVAKTQRPLDHMRDFLNCVRTREKTVANPQVMCDAMIINLAADICDILKRNLRLDLRKAEFVGDAEANRFRTRASRAPWCV